MKTPVDFSVVVPILNEQATIVKLLSQIHRVVDLVGGQWEVIYVNDGSWDRSLEVLLNARATYPFLRIVDLSRNFGHQAALTAGMEQASGTAVIVMDGDLQDDPEAIPALIAKWREGYEIVYAVRVKRKENILKRALFRAFYRLQRSTARVDIPLDAGNFSLLDRKVLDVLRAMPERNRYFPGLRAFAGFRQIGVEVERGHRYDGGPRVNTFGLLKLALDGLIAFSTAPLRFVFLMGLIVSIGSVAIATTGLYFRFILGRTFLDWPFGLTTIFFFGGVQLISIGIIGEYVGRVYEEVKRRPYYIIRETIGFEQSSSSDRQGSAGT